MFDSILFLVVAYFLVCFPFFIIIYFQIDQMRSVCGSSLVQILVIVVIWFLVWSNIILKYTKVYQFVFNISVLTLLLYLIVLCTSFDCIEIHQMIHFARSRPLNSFCFQFDAVCFILFTWPKANLQIRLDDCTNYVSNICSN